jgi:hypothetical protein
MSYITLILLLALIGVVAWAVTKYIPMTPGIATLIKIVAVVLAVLLCLSAFGLLGDINLQVPHVHR